MNSFPRHLPSSTETPLRGGAVLRWGVLAPGQIAFDFVTTLHRNTDQRVHAVASRSIERAETFAREFEIPRAYGDYERLVADPDIDVVYIAAPHSEHRRLALLAIAAGKHVLVEKPIGVNAGEARDIAEAARAAGVFAMEAMWSRFLPQTTVIATLLEDGAFGDVGIVTADFGGVFEFDPLGRAFNPKLGGGALLDLGVYSIWFANFALGAPSSVTATGTVTSTGVDGQSALVLGTESGAQALVSSSMLAATPVTASISGSLARVEIDGPFVSPGGFTLHGVGASEPLRFDDATGFRWRDGLAWQATAVANHIADGLTESPLHPLDRTIEVLATIDEARRQLGLPA
ncbi:MAG: oxidoreductase [Microbacteriaceae bacterium]|nr:oxidoreductase [Microbacteriaceae bacterium]